MHSKKGFTLIEMLIVISVISILLSFMMLSVRGMQNEARVSRARADLRTLQVAIEAYFKNHNNNGSGGYLPAENYQRTLLTASPRILSSNMFDPFGETFDSLYKYDLSGNEKYYILYSLGLRSNGRASIADSGDVTVTNKPICVTNGRIVNNE